MKVLSKTKAAYLAGLIDGEGSIFVQRVKAINKKASKTGFQYRGGFAVVMTDLETVRWCAKVTGCGKVSGPRLGRKHHRSSYRWSVWSKQSALVLSEILPYLRLKKPHAKNLIAFQSMMGWFGSPGSPKSEILRRERHRKISMKLNKRGR